MTEKKLIWTTIAVSAAALTGLFFFLRAHHLQEVSDRMLVPIEGAVVQREADPNKERPISDVVVTEATARVPPPPSRMLPGISKSC
jgi:hypothetical protein